MPGELRLRFCPVRFGESGHRNLLNRQIQKPAQMGYVMNLGLSQNFCVLRPIGTNHTGFVAKAL